MKDFFQNYKFLAAITILLSISCQNKVTEKEENQEVIDSTFVSVSNDDSVDKSFDYYPTSTSNQIIKHDNYTLSYKEEFEQAEWVAYEIKKGRYSNQDYQRPFFIEDPMVKTGSADWRNYKNSGYDKGHLCAAGDMKFSKAAFEETFFTSNISPQDREFNSGIWNRLEQKTRYWANKYDGIYVVTGGVLKDNLETIGKEDVAVPDYFYKVLLNKNNGNYKMIAFLMPNEDSEKGLYEFVVSVDEVEKLTGINFFPKLEDSIEDKLEKSSDYKNWSF